MPDRASQLIDELQAGPENPSRSSGASMNGRHWYRGWNIVAISCLPEMIVIGLAQTSFSFWVSYWMAGFSAPRASVMSAATVMLVSSAVASPVVGQLTGRYKIRTLQSVGLAMFAAGFALAALLKTLIVFVFLFGAMMGAAAALCGPIVAQTLAARWFDRRRGLAISITVAALSLGNALMPLVTVFLLGSYGSHKSALIIAAAGLATVPIVLAVIRDSPESAGVQIEAPATSGTPPTPYDRGLTQREILGDRNFWVMVLAFVPIYISGAGFFINFQPIMDDVGIGASTAASIFSLASVVSAACKILIGRLSDKLDHRPLLLAALMFTAAGCALIAVQPPRWIATIAVLSISIGSQASFFALQGAVAARYFGARNVGPVLGLLFMFFLVGAIAPPAAGAVRDLSGSYSAALWACVVGLVAVSPSIFWLKLRTGPVTPCPSAYGGVE